MQNVYFIDPNFILDTTKTTILSIRYSTDGFSFCIHNKHQKLVAFSHQTLPINNLEANTIQLKEHITNDPLLKRSYLKVYLMPCNRDKTLIPAPFFNPAFLPQLCALNQNIQIDNKFISTYISPINSYLVEMVPTHFIDFIRLHYPNHQFVNCTYPFLQDAFAKMQSDQTQLFIDIQDQYFDLLLLQNNSPKLFTTFNYQTETDVMYYLLNCLEKCQIDKTKVSIFLSGSFANNSKWHELANAYLRPIHYIQSPQLNITLQDKHFNSSSFVHLLNLHKCEL